ncbi:GNAT family N-acetyltransferase [Lysinibacillus piscis]|nr:GNAT family protein [Lysinibacillus sp. KH24]
MELVKYEERYKANVQNYQLVEEQLRYTNTPQNCLQLAEQDADRANILALNDNGELVTFFVLHANEGVKPYSDNDKAILLRAFSTDFHHQGKGYAKQALLILPHFVEKHYPTINEIVLAVNEANVGAQVLYHKCGFVDRGVRRMGTKGPLIIMSYDVPKA